MKALLLAAGLGTRLKPITNTMPKCLVPINGKPLLEIWLENLTEAGIKEFLINTHYLHKEVENFIMNSKYKDVVTLVYEENLLGTAGTLVRNKSFFVENEPLMVIHADNLCICDFKDFISSHYLRENKDTLLTMMLFHTDTPQSCGIVELDKNNIVQKFYEKVKFPPSNLANAAVYIFEYSIFNIIEKIESKYPDISIDLLPVLLGKINTYKNNQLNIDIGTPSNYKKAHKLYKDTIKNSQYKYLINFFSNKTNFTNYVKKRKEIQNKLKLQKKHKYKNNRLLCIYDCIDLPISNDIITVLIHSEIERIKSNFDKIDLAFIIHESDPSPDRHPYVTSSNRKQFLYNMIIEQTRVFENIGSIFIFDNRNEFLFFFNKNKRFYSIFPKDYNPYLPIESLGERTSIHSWINISSYLKYSPNLLCLTPPKDQVILARKWIKKNICPKIPITITLREWDSWADERNSKINEWQKLIDYYKDNKEIFFIVIRDYYKIYDENDPLIGENIIYCNEAALSNSFRAALYQESTLNLFVSNGSAIYAIANEKVKYIFFSICSNGRGASKEAIRQNLGLYYGDSFQGSNSFQKIVWERDYFDVLKKEVEDMLKKIEKNIGLEPSFYNNTEDFNLKTTNINSLQVIDSPLEKRPSLRKYHIFYILQYLVNKISDLKKLIVIQPLSQYFNRKYKLQKLKKAIKKDIFQKENKSTYLIHNISHIRKNNKKILIYGAGAIGEELYPILKDNIICYIDINGKAFNPKSKISCKIEKTEILKIKLLSYDYIIITPRFRELQIAKMLVYEYEVPEEKILLF